MTLVVMETCLPLSPPRAINSNRGTPNKRINRLRIDPNINKDSRRFISKRYDVIFDVLRQDDSNVGSET